MRTTTRVITQVLLAGLLLSCNGRTEDTDSGGVLLSFGAIDFPAVFSVSGSAAVGGVSIPIVTLQSVVADPSGTTSSLMDIELQTIEITFSRADGGTRLPPPLVRRFPGVVPVNGTLTINGLFVMFEPQLQTPPLSDLPDFGFDTETRSTVVLLNIRIRFFGRTLAGTEVISEPLVKTVQFQP